jgi:hypothetical protein
LLLRFSFSLLSSHEPNENNDSRQQADGHSYETQPPENTIVSNGKNNVKKRIYTTGDKDKDYDHCYLFTLVLLLDVVHLSLLLCRWIVLSFSLCGFASRVCFRFLVVTNITMISSTRMTLATIIKYVNKGR